MDASRIIQRFFLFFLVVLIAVSCKKDLSLIGIDLVDPDELIKMGYTDTVRIQAYSVAEDSVRTNGLSIAMVGSMNDPVFGRTTANWFSQIRLSKEPTNFGAFPRFDSAFLILPYSGSYGDTLSNMTLRVYELTEDIIDSVHTHSNHTIAYNTDIALGELTFTPRPADSSYFNGKKQTPTLRIPLNSKFALKTLFADTSHLSSNTRFLEHFKGLALIAEPQQSIGNGAILKLKVTAGSSKIELYYHNETDTSTYAFGINSDCRRFNQYNHDGYLGASPMLTQQVIDTNIVLGDQLLFVQAMGGIRIKLRFPFADEWKTKQNIVVNDAQLILTNASASPVFSPPSSLALYPVADDGTLYPFQLPDADEGSDYFDGKYNKSSRTYRFRISRYLQQVINGDRNNKGLFLIIPGSSLTSDRLVINGFNAPQSGIRLFVKYTIIEQ